MGLVIRAESPLLVIGGAGCEPLADAVGRLLGAPVVRLADCGDGDVHSVDLDLLQRAVDAHDGGEVVIVAGQVALALPPLRWAARWRVAAGPSPHAAVVADPAAVAALVRGA